MEAIGWLFFDLGSTLIDESEVIKSRCDYAIKEKKLNRDEFMAKVCEMAETSATAILAVAESYGVTLPPWNNNLEKLYPETPAVLEKLAQKYKLGIIANQVEGTQKRIDNWGIGKYFDVVVASAEAGVAKPDSAIFKIALEKSGCKPENAAMIGDRLDNDIIPAKKLGMKTIWVRQALAVYQKVRNDEEQPDFTIDSIREITEVLLKKIRILRNRNNTSETTGSKVVLPYVPGCPVCGGQYI